MSLSDSSFQFLKISCKFTTFYREYEIIPSNLLAIRSKTALKRLAIFIRRAVVDDAQIAGIARLADAVFLKSPLHGASRFMDMRAIVVFAIGRLTEYFWKIVCHLLHVEVNRAKALHSRSVDDIPPASSASGYISENVVVCIPV